MSSIYGIVNNGTNSYNFSGGSFNTVIATLNGTGGLTNSGGATTDLAGANTYSGGTLIDDSTLILNGSGTLGAITGTTTLTNNATLNLGGTTQVQSLLIMGGGLATNGTISNTEILFTSGANIVSSSIVGTSSVMSTGGTNVLSGTNNTYTGGTTVNNSTLIVENGSSLGDSNNTLSINNGDIDLSGGIQEQRTIIVNDATIEDGTLMNASINSIGGTNNLLCDISGSSSITNTLGTTILSGSNSYSGITKLDGGNLIVNSITALGTSGLLLNGGNINLNSSASVSSFTWSSTNSIFIIGSGASTLIVNGTFKTDNTGYHENVFQLGSLNNNFNIAIASLTNSSISINSFCDTSGAANFSLGTTNINGINYNTIMYQIGTNANITITSTQTISANFTVDNLSYASNATLIVAKDASLNVTDNYTSTNSGTLNYQFGSTTDPTRITVGGTMALGGNFVGNFVGGAMPIIGSQYAFAQASQVTGSFINSGSTEVDINGVNNPYLRGHIICKGDPTLYDLIAPRSYTYVAQNPNQYSVASALDSFIQQSGDEGVVYTALDHLAVSQYPAAFNAISPALYTSMPTIAISTAVNQYNEMVQRLAYVRVAGVGFNAMGFNDSPIMDDNKKPNSSQKDILIPSIDNHWGFFVDGNGVFANINNVNPLPGYSAESGGVIVGGDYKWNNSFSTGLYAGYEGMQTKQSGGNFISDNGSRFGLFATYQNEGLFANAIAGGASHSYQVNRSIIFSNFNRTANSAPTAGELDSLLATGYDVKKGNFTFGPNTSLQYTYFGLQPFTETGAQSLDLSVANANTSSLVYILGSHCLYDWKANKDLSIVPQLSLGWQHEFLQNPYTLSSSFGNGANFNYTTASVQRDSLFSSIGFNINFKKKYDASFNYTASSCNPSLLVQGFNVSLGMGF